MLIISILLILQMVCWSELDLYAPSFPLMKQFFDTDEQTMQLTLSLNFLGLFLSSLVCGPLADSFGRRRVLIGGMLIFTIGSVICVTAPNMGFMLLGRFIQGIGVSAPVTMTLAIVADLCQGDKQGRLLSLMNTSTTIVMAGAPILGVYLTESFGWRSNFFVIAVGSAIGCLLSATLLSETLAPEHRQRFHLKGIFAAYWKLALSPVFMGISISISALAAAYFTFIGLIPFLFMDQLGVSLHDYGYYQGAVVGSFAITSLFLSTLLRWFSSDQILRWSYYCILFSATALLIVGVMNWEHPLTITILMGFFGVGVAAPGSILFARAMDLFPELRASAASLATAIRLFVMAFATSLSGSLYDGRFLWIAVVLFVLGVGSYLIVRRQLATTF
jgi:DHA1 family bicyclomycin/chloramphenicol resistance-like MFS transporter